MSEAAQEKAARNSMYSLKPPTKRKRDVINDSDDDVYSDDSPDAKLARQLQAEEDRKGKISLLSEDEDEDDNLEALERDIDITATSSGRKDKGKSIPSRRTSTRASSAKKPMALVDSDPDSDFNDDDSVVEPSISRLASKKKGAKVALPQRKKPAQRIVLLDEDDSIDDAPGKSHPRHATISPLTLCQVLLREDEADLRDLPPLWRRLLHLCPRPQALTPPLVMASHLSPSLFYQSLSLLMMTTTMKTRPVLHVVVPFAQPPTSVGRTELIPAGSDRRRIVTV